MRANTMAHGKPAAALLRARDASGHDSDHQAEAVETRHDDQRIEIACHLRAPLMHLLRWAVEPGTREARRSAITGERIVLDDFQAMSPRLAAEWPTWLGTAYTDARRHVAQDTEPSVETFPVQCPWSLAQLMDHGFLPGALDVSAAGR
jgi:Domain of unknown function DUF29